MLFRSDVKMSKNYIDLPRIYKKYVLKYSLVQSRQTEREKIIHISQNNSINLFKEYIVVLSIFQYKINSDQGNYCKVDQDSLTEC